MMKTFKISMLSLLVTLLCVIGISDTFSQTHYLDPKGKVSDFAGVLSPSDVTKLHNELEDYKSKTDVEIAVVTVNSLDGLTIEDYAQNLFQKWGIGNKEKNSGVLFLICPSEKKMRIHTGYGVEEFLTDAACKRILSQEVKPYFKKGDLTSGIFAGVRGIKTTFGDKPLKAKLEEIAQAKRAEELESQRMTQNFKMFLFILLIVLSIGVIVFFSVKHYRKKKEEFEKLKSDISDTKFSINEKLDNLKEYGKKYGNKFKPGTFEFTGASLSALSSESVTKETLDVLLILCEELNSFLKEVSIVDKIETVKDRIDYEVSRIEKMKNNWFLSIDTNKYKYDDVFEMSTEYHTKLIQIYNTVSSDINKCEGLIALNNQHMRENGSDLTKLSNKLGDSVKKYSSYKSVIKFDSNPNNIHLPNIKSLYDEFVTKRSQKTNLNEIEKAYSKYSISVSSALNLLTIIDDDINHYESCKSSVSGCESKLNSMLKDAESNTSKKYVTSGTKNKLDQVKKDVSNFVSKVSNGNSSNLDYLILFGVLTSLFMSIESVSRSARRDIEEEEERIRRKKREEEERARRKREEEDRRRRNSYSSSSSSSWSSSSSFSS